MQDIATSAVLDFPILIATSARLRTAVVAEIGRSRALIDHSRRSRLERYLRSPFGRRIAGGSEANGQSESIAEALWRFLQDNRGLMLCARCLAVALAAPRRIDRALVVAEGRGAKRRYGVCPRCNKDRLLSGFPPPRDPRWTSAREPAGSPGG